MHLTQELHVIRAHHLHYSSLLEDFRKTIEFIRDTENPALASLEEDEQKRSRDIMARETSNLLGEVERLEKGRRMQDRRLKNVMNLVCSLQAKAMRSHSFGDIQVFSSVNITDSKRMHKMTEAAVRDSAAVRESLLLRCPDLTTLQMKQIAYLTMVFLPASFIAVSSCLALGPLGLATLRW